MSELSLLSDINIEIIHAGRWGYGICVEEVSDGWLGWTVYDGAAWTLRGAQRKLRRFLRRRYLRKIPSTGVQVMSTRMVNGYTPPSASLNPAAQPPPDFDG